MADPRAPHTEDAPSTTAAALSLNLSDAEREMLELYDQLEELKLEMALLQAQSENLNGEFLIFIYNYGGVDAGFIEADLWHSCARPAGF